MLSINDIDTDKDYYKILNISRNASSDEIKRGYKKLAVKYHPDKNIGKSDFTKKFCEVVEAYEILKTYHLRQAYDLYLAYKIPLRGYQV